MSSAVASPLNIIGWSAMSPFGTGRADFREGVCAARRTARPVDREAWQVSDDHACLVPEFDVRTALGRKGTRMMNRLTGFAVATSGDLLQGLDREALVPEETGLVLGTTVGSAQSAIDFTRGSLSASKPFHVEAGLIPYAVMNGAAGQCAIWHGLKGPNATVAAGRAAGLLALRYARRLLLTDRATTVLCGAAEEYSAARSWITRTSAEASDTAVLGEGCAMFALTTSDAPGPVLARLLAVRAMTCSEGDWETVVTRCVEQLFAATGEDRSAVWALSPSDGASESGRAERAALTAMFPADCKLVPVTGLIGETHAASAAFQLAALVSAAADDPAGHGGLGVVTSTDECGTVAAALLRLA